MPKKPLIDPTDEDFGTVLNCAIRYAIGRETYMPRLVIGFIKPLLPYLSNKTLWCMERDVDERGKWGERAYGDPQIDKPAWMELRYLVRAEMDRRKMEHA